MPSLSLLPTDSKKRRRLLINKKNISHAYFLSLPTCTVFIFLLQFTQLKNSTAVATAPIAQTPTPPAGAAAVSGKRHEEGYQMSAGPRQAHSMPGESGPPRQGLSAAVSMSKNGSVHSKVIFCVLCVFHASVYSLLAFAVSLKLVNYCTIR